MTKGFDVFLFSKTNQISLTEYKVLSDTGIKNYNVNLSDWSCDCDDFVMNNGYTCKHMFGCMYYTLKEEGKDIKSFKILDPFLFIKRVRCLIVESDFLKKFIKMSDFPVTIGEEYFEELCSTNAKLKENLQLFEKNKK